MPFRRTLFRATLGGAVLASALALGCATTKPPVAEAIGAAEYALRKAKEDGAAQYAPVDVRQAEDKLARARALREDGQEQAATRLAHEVSLEAQLAEAKASNARMRRTRDEIQKSVDDLRAEIERAQMQ